MVACNIFFNLLAGSAWIGLVILLDTHRREKKSQVVLLKFFLFGFLCLIPMTILYLLSYAFWWNFLDDGRLFVFIDEMFITGPVEEFSKFIVFLLLSRKMKSIKEPIDGVLQAGTVALAELTAALRCNPGSCLLNQRAALLHLYYRDFSKALAHIRTCRERRPANPYFQCLEAVVRILNGKIGDGAELMEKAYPRLSQESRTALVRNIRRVISRSDPSLPEPLALGPEHPLTSGFFEKITGLRAPTATRSYSRVQLTRRRYLAKAG